MNRSIRFLCLILIFWGCNKPKDNLRPEPPVPPSPVVNLPSVVTYPHAELTRYSVKITGAVTDSGDAEVSEAGFVVDIAPLPTIQRSLNKFVCVPDTAGKMLVIIVDIPPSQTYYLRAYATNQQGTTYGNEIEFMSLSEKVYAGNVTLSTQQQVVDFGNEQYTRIGGSLQITGSVTDLSSLNHLSTIGTNLTINFTQQLTSLKGLDSLEAVNTIPLSYQGIRIENNSALKSLVGLGKLTSNKGYLYIINNDELDDLNGLQNFQYNYFGEVRIDGCEKIRSLHGLERFSGLDGDIMLMNNPQLMDITAFSSLSVVSGAIRIYNCDALQHVNGFEKLHSLAGIELQDNQLLSNLQGFRNIEKLGGLMLNNNDVLSHLSGFEKITSLDGLTILNSPAFTSLSGLENIRSVKYRISISNSGITNLQGLNNLAQAPTIALVDNEKLSNLQGLNNLTKLSNNDYSLTITRNYKLTSLSGLENLSSADGQFYIGFNSLLGNFCGLKHVFESGRIREYVCEGNSTNPTIAEVISNCR